MPKNPTPRLAILGAGPIGLEAGLYAKQLQLPFTIYERGRTAEHLRQWGHVRLFTPFGMNVTALGRHLLRTTRPQQELPADDALLTGREHVEKYLAPLAESLAGQIKTETLVVQVGRRGCFKHESDPERARQPFLLHLREKNKDRFEEADVVLDCTGTYAQHRWLGPGGLQAIGEAQLEAQIAYGLEDVLGDKQKDYVNRSILLVGAGYSAATTACNLAQLAESQNTTWITWVARGSQSQPLRRIPNDPLRERDRIAVRANNLATRTDANVEYHSQTVVETIESLGQGGGFRVTCRSAGRPRIWEVERIIGNVGHTPASWLHRELQIQDCPFTLAPQKLATALASQRTQDLMRQTALGPDSLRNPEPNYFILGAKSYGRLPLFLLRVGFEQVRDVFTLIMGNAGLDLYASTTASGGRKPPDSTSRSPLW
jgi:thioredoxin reductase